MFGALFQEDEDLGGVGFDGIGSRRMMAKDEPPKPRGLSGFVGLDNQGATCYLNSLIQMLYLTPELREGLFSLNPQDLGIEAYEKDEEVSSGGQKEDDGSKVVEEEKGKEEKEEAMMPTAGGTCPFHTDEEAIVQQLIDMGFSRHGSERAAVACQKEGLTACIEWAILHSDDADFNSSLLKAATTTNMAQSQSSSSSSPCTSSQSVGNSKSGSTHNSNSKTTSSSSSNIKARMIPLELQRLFTQLQLSDQRSISTDELTSRGFHWQSYEGRVQQDVHELVRLLMDALERSLVRTSGESLISSLYKGQQVYKTVCNECGSISERAEDFQDIIVKVKGQSSLLEGLEEQCRVERMDGENSYQCDTCQTKTTADRSLVLRSLPPILLLGLNRFDYDMRTFSRIKLTSRFTYPMVLNMRRFMEESDGPPEIYELAGVIIHQGTAYSGHYHLYARDNLGEGHWVEGTTRPSAATDDAFSSMSVEKNKTMIPHDQEPLDLLKEILASGEAKDVNGLGNEIKRKKLKPWNKLYLRDHGPLPQFLRRYPQYFLVNEKSGKVSLNPTKSQEPEEEQATDGKDMDDLPEQSATNENSTTTKSSSSSSNPSRARRRWFDFDDSMIFPIHDEVVVNKPVEGRDSAYLLVYRSRALSMKATTVPLEPPAYWKDRIEAENRALRQAREAFQKRLNTITLQVLSSSQVEHRAPYLVTRSKGALSSVSSVQVDLRQGLQGMKEKVLEVLTTGASSDFPMTLPVVWDHLRLHIIRDRGMIEDDRELLYLQPNNGEIQSSSLFMAPERAPDELLVLAWNDSQVNQTTLCLDVEHLPVPMTLLVKCLSLDKKHHNYRSCSTVFTQRIHLDQQKSTVKDLVEGIEHSLGMDRHNFILHCVRRSAFFRALLVYSPKDESTDLIGKKITEFFTDHAEVLLEEVQIANGGGEYMAELEIAQRNHALTLTVVRGDSVVNREVEVDGRMTLGELRHDVLSLSEEDIMEVAGIYGHEGGASMTFEIEAKDWNKALSTFGLHTGSRIFIKDAEQACKLVVRFRPVTGNDQAFKLNKKQGLRGEIYEVEVLKSMTIRQAKEVMCRAVGWGGDVADDRRLRPTNTWGDALEFPVTEEEMGEDVLVRKSPSLMRGDLILLEEGRAPHKGEICLRFWLWDPPPLGVEEENEEEEEEILDDRLWWKNKQEQCLQELNPVYPMSDWTLQQLKETLLTQVEKKRPDFSLGTTSFLEIRELKHDVLPGAIMRMSSAVQWGSKIQHHNNTGCDKDDVTSLLKNASISGSTGTSCAPRTVKKTLSGGKTYVLCVRDQQKAGGGEYPPKLHLWLQMVLRPALSSSSSSPAIFSPSWPPLEIVLEGEAYPTMFDLLKAVAAACQDLKNNNGGESNVRRDINPMETSTEEVSLPRVALAKYNWTTNAWNILYVPINNNKDRENSVKEEHSITTMNNSTKQAGGENGGNHKKKKQSKRSSGIQNGAPSSPEKSSLSINTSLRKGCLTYQPYNVKEGDLIAVLDLEEANKFLSYTDDDQPIITPQLFESRFQRAAREDLMMGSFKHQQNESRFILTNGNGKGKILEASKLKQPQPTEIALKLGGDLDFGGVESSQKEQE